MSEVALHFLHVALHSPTGGSMLFVSSRYE
ncbi:hypothetical protein Q428_01795 [Fervidicella metallireducens AeB]|uniref:Uncharacterized protein n=1 Tax=Fervidicella metallireducens AeB TaxID=1403537 RepID=A0A017RYF8_9CLOT|nr:hypothetical protein Q428_01795 [Fervidicella metallireducens AeB]